MGVHVPNHDEIQNLVPHSLCFGQIALLKTAKDEEEGPWSFAGIASDESRDVDGDEILRKSLDLSYAQKRGYVNWDHSREPEHQLGVLTKAQIVDGEQIKKLRDKLEMDIPDSATVYTEGSLYRYVPKATEVQRIMKSTPKGSQGLGLSLDGVVARDVADGSVVKAFMRGVAITPVPAHPHTLAMLKKSLQDGTAADDRLILQILASGPKEVVEELKKALNRGAGDNEMSFDEAVLWVLKKRPSFSYDLASKVVKYTIQQKTSKEGE